LSIESIATSVAPTTAGSCVAFGGALISVGAAEAAMLSVMPRCPAALCFCAQERAALPPGPRAARRVGGGKARRGARRKRARSLPVHGRTLNEPRSPLAQSAGTMPADRAARGALLFGYFLLGKQEKVTGPQGCGTNTQGRESVFAKEALRCRSKEQHQR
jgi:hypothetical protein